MKKEVRLNQRPMKVNDTTYALFWSNDLVPLQLKGAASFLPLFTVFVALTAGEMTRSPFSFFVDYLIAATFYFSGVVNDQAAFSSSEPDPASPSSLENGAQNFFKGVVLQSQKSAESAASLSADDQNKEENPEASNEENGAQKEEEQYKVYFFDVKNSVRNKSCLYHKDFRW